MNERVKLPNSQVFDVATSVERMPLALRFFEESVDILWPIKLIRVVLNHNDVVEVLDYALFRAIFFHFRLFDSTAAIICLRAFWTPNLLAVRLNLDPCLNSLKFSSVALSDPDLISGIYTPSRHCFVLSLAFRVKHWTKYSHIEQPLVGGLRRAVEVHLQILGSRKFSPAHLE